MTLGNRVGTLRKERGLSQEDVAAALNVSRQAVSKWENDQSSPDTENLILLAQLLDVEVEYLATGSQPGPEEEGSAEAAIEKPERKRRNMKWMNLLLAVFLCAAIVFCALWQKEKRDKSDLELLCRASAVQCLDALADYSETESQVSFKNSLADFRTFMQCYHLLTEDTGGNGKYISLNEVYGSMVCAPERIDANLDDLIRAMGLLSKDIYDYTGHNLMYDLYIELRHG